MQPTSHEPSLIYGAWQRILNIYAEKLVALDQTDSYYAMSPSILDAIQGEYRAERLSESERDAMREHVRQWLGNPDTIGENVAYRSVDDYARYACGVWAGSTGPMGRDEHAIILMTVTILAEESK
jgi:hypothetical protein